MREAFSTVFLFLVVALVVCAIIAFCSKKSIGPSVGFLLLTLVPPVIGNLIIVSSSNKANSTVGCYIYFLGMNLVMLALYRFTFIYCRISAKSRRISLLVYALLAIDTVQLLLNPIFGHAFDTEAVLVDWSFYYRLRPYGGQTFHRLVDYGIFAGILIVFIVKMFRSPRIYSERYSVILFTMIVAGAWETYYIFSRTPVDRSMVGFGVFGLLVFYFSLYYRPVRLMERMLANVASEVQASLFFFDAVGRSIWTNAPGLALTGIEKNDFERAAKRLEEMFGSIQQKEDGWTSRRVIETEEGTRYYELEKHSMRDKHGNLDGFFLSVRDNTLDEQMLRQEKYNATHDRLTDLYTREYLYQRVHEMIQAKPDTRYYVIFVNVNEFKMVNDIFGADFGDYALQCVANLIREEISANGVFGRLAGDTFGICEPVGEFHPEQVEKLLSEFVVKDGTVEHHILMHLGVYEVMETGLDVSVMFDRAHMALSTIKGDYQKHIAYYDEGMRKRALWNQHISSQLHDAIRQRQVVPYLQPIVDREGKVVGAEALVRWIHPVDGFLPPGLFIPVFEKNGMIAEVDKYMWRCACEILAGWKGKHDDVFISVNISPKDFYFMDVAAEIKSVVKEFDIDPRALRVEITETVMMTDLENRIRILRELQDAGFVVEMDDFGSGYSSLNMLKDMPVDVIKVDMMFLNQAKNDERAETILHNVINMTEDLGIQSLTEGVETQEQYQMLARMGCELFQGYHFSKPIPVEDFEKTYL